MTTTTTEAPTTPTTTTTSPSWPLETCYTISNNSILYNLSGTPAGGSYTDGSRVLYWDIYGSYRWIFNDFTTSETWVGPFASDNPVGLYTNELTTITVLGPCWAASTTTTTTNPPPTPTEAPEETTTTTTEAPGKQQPPKHRGSRMVVVNGNHTQSFCV